MDTLPSLSQVIKDHGLLGDKKLSKRLGQNFLLDPSITDRIAKAAGVLTGFHVIEIGPGPGGLTRSLLKAGADHVYAVERDRNCVAALQPLLEASQGRLTLVQADALKVVPQTLTPSPLKIIANLPYNVGTQLLLNWLKNLAGLHSLTLMFQREVALRIVAPPGSGDYGRLSILCQYLCEAERLFDLSPQSFTPPPKVFSSVVHLHPKVLSDEAKSLVPYLEKVTMGAFGQRRKMIRKSLKPLFGEEKLEEVLALINVPPQERPENLTLDHYRQLAKFYSQLS
ncbi:16S rRNA (adenine(1518)-N(6)/adenine(1519)-N(6))-dimethyltransferase RsmA [Candidatus Finniella inopinata]|uniref:Ribosomal RNA small subunit methyltransferase A n=1 Tax=Candidatus Finniella inopinata TaxID=1696036 RepID=A0A4Q7DK63_9PROT|nr:16S rRNA (adenine(1518)-N(6)/adenine(1519)-N(6))-dimethyltransferase RsmA [Candidatus Finniella inopinata]